MFSLSMLLAATTLIAISGLLPLASSAQAQRGQRLSMLLNVLGSCAGAAGLALFLAGGSDSLQFSRSWPLPFGQFSIGIDALTAIFLIPMLLISALGSIYGLQYWPQLRHPGNARRLRLFWGLMTAGMMLVVLARDSAVFLIGWEVMAISAFFLVCTQETRAPVRWAGWIYLVAAHVGTLTLFAFFALLRHVQGNFELWSSLPPKTSDAIATCLFLLGILGFGVKAGIMPLHIWLPNAHANAPSHVSAILSGVLLKTGVYGLIRLAALSPHPALWWGWTLLGLGGVSGIVAIAFALSQHDYKRMLAYSSIENVGIIMIGVGLALLGQSTGQREWIVLGLGGALLHALNHSMVKSLLFMGAGSVLHATHTRRLDRLGGLGKLMPRTYLCFFLGALAICALPPLNGFVSELLLYVGLLKTSINHTQTQSGWGMLAAPALAMIGALSVAAFVKLTGAIFAGGSRSHCTTHAHDPGSMMLLPMALLAAGCLLIGLWPALVTGLIDRAIAAWNPAAASAKASIQSLIPLAWVSAISASLIAAMLILWQFLLRRRRRSDCTEGVTWDCGYARPTNRMQYTGSSFVQMLTEMFRWALLTRTRSPSSREIFAPRMEFSTQTPDTVLDRGVLPAFSAGRRAAVWARILQSGPVQVYVLYVLGALLVLMLVS